MARLKNKIHSENVRTYVLMFSCGALIYSLCEILYRGYTHFTMVILGGICGVAIHKINKSVTDAPILTKALLCSFAITALEFFAGIVLNLILGMKVWDYSGMPFHILGQICPVFSIIWFIISIPSLFLSSFINKQVTPSLKGRILFL